ncbi:MAG TPA: MDR family MFS transporter, partial [Gaiellaceae bacterium]|nr:MDR family MFS transporter [Gaiellaceae bacterium]
MALRATLDSQPDGYRIPIGRVLAIYSGLMLVNFLSSTDQTIVTTALPHVVADIGGLSEYSWIFTAYLLAATIAIPLYGKLGDVYGKRPMLLVSVSIFLVGSMLCGIARSMPELIAFRAVQGLGAGGLVPLSMATIGSMVPLRDRGRYQAFIVAAFAGGAGVGPLLGGLIVDHASWPWIFYVNAPFGLLALAIVFRMMTNPPRGAHRPVDWLGASTLAAASALLMLGLLWGGRTFAWSSPVVIATLSAALVAWITFAVVERRAAEPILLFTALRQRAVACSVVCYALGGWVMLGSITYVPLFVQIVVGTSATRSGLVLWPQFVGTSVASLVVGQFMFRSGRLRPTALLGPFVLVTGVVLLWRMDVHVTSGQVARDTILSGVGWGLMAQVFIVSVQNAVPRSLITSATALMVFSRSMGAALGVSAMGAIVNHGLPSGM